jgi:molybdate transport system ATP-binding protein
MIRFHAHTALPFMDLSFELEQGAFLAVCGPSGAGKTTLLRMLAGLTSPGTGRIEVDGRVWDDGGAHRPPQLRSVGMVFQDFALFPHLSVRENITFALPDKEDTKRVDWLLDRTDLGGLARRKPSRLSGGQQQRVALARALARKPRLLLLDEALVAQDTTQRVRLWEFLLEVHRAEALTTLLVTHDEMEVRRLADRVLYLENGRSVRSGKPVFDIY